MLPSLPPWDQVKPVLLHAVLPPFALAIFVTAMVLLIAGRKRATLATALGMAIGIGLGWWLHGPLTRLSQANEPWVAARDIDLWLDGHLTLQGGETPWNRLPWAALAALWIGRIARMAAVSPIACVLLRGGAALGTAWLVIPSAIRRDVDWLMPAFAAVILATWALLEYLAAEPIDADPPFSIQPKSKNQLPIDEPTGRGGGAVPLLVALALFTAGLVCVHASTGRLMEAAFVAGAALAGVALVATLCRADAGGALPAAAILLPGLLLMAQQTTYSEIPWYGFALPAVVPLLLAESLPLRRWHGVWLTAAQVILMLAACLAVK
jgi:hypothetical protein